MATTNLIDGVTNVATTTALGSYIMPDPTSAHTWFDDFDDYSASEWVITETGTGSRAVGNLDGGVLVVTNAALEDDANRLQWSGLTNAAVVETFKFESEKPLWMKARFKVSVAAQNDVMIGLYITDTDPIGGVSDGVFFRSADGSAVMSLVVEKNSTETVTTAGTLANDTWVTAGFYYDGGSKIDVYWNDVRVGSSVTTNLPDDEELAVSFAIQNGEAVAGVLSLDYLFISKSRQ
jgi:hypothetical protein